MVAHVGAFGAARSPAVVHSCSVGMKGTIGYIAPEHEMGGQASTKGDVYSYGILLLEMITGKELTDEIFEENLTLHHFRNKMRDCLCSMARIDLACSAESPRERMEISKVLRQMHAIRESADPIQPRDFDSGQQTSWSHFQESSVMLGQRCSAKYGSVGRVSTLHYVSSLSSAHLNAMINDHVRIGRLANAQKLFDENHQCRDVTSWNSMLNGYIQRSRFQCAIRLFDEMPERDVVSWNTMLAGFRWAGDSEQAIQLFLQMERLGFRATEFTLTTVVSAASETGFLALITQLHSRAINLAFQSNSFVGTSLIGGYANLGDFIAVRQAFSEIILKNIVSWNALISAYMSLGFICEARAAFEMMPERNIVSWTSLVNGYICNKMLDEASRCFDRMPEKNVISWTAMISGFEQSGLFIQSVEFFLLMRDSGIQPNEATLSTVLSACAGCSSLVFGKQIHAFVFKLGIPLDVILLSSLVNMYAKCGDMDAAAQIFDSMRIKNLIAWNSIIGGYARHGLPLQALNEFRRMNNDCTRPDHITFISVLSACAHGGLVEEGERYFGLMEKEFGIKAGLKHYTCMVDLYGRAGLLDKAERFIQAMPFEPDMVMWGALLAACGAHSSLELGSHAAECIYSLEKDHPAIFLLLSKLHGEKGAWNEVFELREMMREKGAKKQKGTSWIESSLVLA